MIGIVISMMRIVLSMMRSVDRGSTSSDR